jgi:hypothetical protein
MLLVALAIAVPSNNHWKVMGAVPVAETGKVAVAPGERNWFAGWVVMTGWAKANEEARHPRQTLTTMLLKCFMLIYGA